MKVLAFILLSAAAASAQILFQRIVDADRETGNWLTYTRTLNGQRYSR